MSHTPETPSASTPAPAEPPARPAGYISHGQASIWRTVVSIAWAFFGVRKGADYEEDIKRLNIFHIIFVGLAGGFALVIALMLLAKWATA